MKNEEAGVVVPIAVTLFAIVAYGLVSGWSKPVEPPHVEPRPIVATYETR